MSKWPPALTSMYVLPPANQEIDLYQGKALVRNNLFSAEGLGRIYLQWNPRKQLVFEVAAPFTHAEMYGEGVEVITEEFKSGVPGKLLHLEHSYKDGVTGTKFFGLLGAVGVAYGAGSLESEKAIFHLVNFENDGGADFIPTAGGGFLAGRHTLETDEWIITLDSLDTKISEELEKQGGFCITQICKLERQDGLAFHADRSQNVLAALSYFLSFSRGSWIPAILPFGVNGDSELVWRLLALPPKASTWQKIDGLFQTSPFWPKQSFGRFLERWEDEVWGEPIKRCVHWYVEGSLKAGGIEGSIILLAAAFELLAWTILFEDPKTKRYNDEDYFDEKVSAKTKLENLLLWAGASVKLLLRHKSLKQVVKENHWNNNGAETFLTVRNTITHESPKNRQARFDIPPEALYETYLLGMGYLRGFIQKLLDYPNAFITATISKK